MKHPQNVDLFALYSIRNEERIGLHHKLSCTRNAPWPSHCWLIYQQVNQAIHL
uniref:Uncharacterized protein n=1 Tax=Aeromonas hydrophila TaxID=644 RepID=G9GAX8_AERHY|nr:hypothetical protein [Aeromonas hydrophila]